jgi:hypothetical protein
MSSERAKKLREAGTGTENEERATDWTSLENENQRGRKNLYIVECISQKEYQMDILSVCGMEYNGCEREKSLYPGEVLAFSPKPKKKRLFHTMELKALALAYLDSIPCDAKLLIPYLLSNPS